jgi:hypothetical protein
MTILLGGVLALWIALIVWAIASDRQAWKEIECDTALLEALCRPGTRARVHRARAEGSFWPQYDAYADVPEEAGPLNCANIPSDRAFSGLRCSGRVRP